MLLAVILTGVYVAWRFTQDQYYVGADGKGEMTNYRVRDQIYIVDRLFDRANLLLGAGKKAQKVEISRGEPKG